MNIILIENNKTRLKIIINKISQSINDAKIFSIFFDASEAISLCNKNNIDVIIFDGSCQNVSSITLLNIVEKFNNSKPLIIFILDYKNIPTNLDKKQNIKIIIKKTNDNQIVKEIITEISNENENLIIEKIKNELKKLKFNFSHIGTNYLIKSIYEIYKLEDNTNVNLSKNIFPIVGDNFNKNPNTIHSGIKRSISNMYYDCEESIINEYFNCYCFDERSKLKEIIFKIISKIK